MLLLFQRKLVHTPKLQLFNPSQRINQSIKYNYIRKKELDLIKSSHGNTWLQQLKVYSKQAKYIYKQGWAAFKHDVKMFYQLRKRIKENNIPLSNEEKKQQKRMRQQLERLKTLVIIQILPFSGILLLFYAYAYPASIPSWFTVDTFYQNHQLQCIENQKQAIKYFKLYPIKANNFHVSRLTAQQIKRLSELLFGHYEDGVVGYNKVLPNVNKQYLFHPQFSKYLLLRNLKKEFRQDVHSYPELKGLSLEEQVLWKYQKIMKGQLLIKFQSVDSISSKNEQAKHIPEKKGQQQPKNK